MVEHSTADREVPGSNPGAPSFFILFFYFLFLTQVEANSKITLRIHNCRLRSSHKTVPVKIEQTTTTADIIKMAVAKFEIEVSTMYYGTCTSTMYYKRIYSCLYYVSVVHNTCIHVHAHRVYSDLARAYLFTCMCTCIMKVILKICASLHIEICMHAHNCFILYLLLCCCYVTSQGGPH